jgi:hypothetical protein
VSIHGVLRTGLTAIRALFRYASLRAPEHAALIARVLAILCRPNTQLEG